MKSSLNRPKSRIARNLKRAWDWMHRRMYPDEPLLAALRSARLIEVYHPDSLTSGAVLDLWNAYLGHRLRRHLPWLLFNLPGPNVIGYWFAYRAVHHLLILHGIRRALGGRVETTFHPVSDLDPSGGPGDGEWLNRTATRYELKGLHDYVERIAPGAATLSGEEATGGMQRPCDS
jgi:hypothetical protein